jgi:hypothetical protein
VRVSDEKRELLKALEERDIRKAKKEVWHWLGHHTATEDEHDTDEPVKPFPQRPYFPLVFDVLDDPNEPVVWVEKSRTMMMSWSLAGWACHEMFTRPYTGIVVQSADEARAIKVVNYMKCLWRRSDPRLKAMWKLRRPLERQPYDRFEAANGSWVLGVSGDPDRIRSEHPTIVILDEAAFIPTDDNYNVAVATRCLKIICNSSAEAGWMHEVIREARPAEFPRTGKHEPIKGVTFRRTAKGHAVIRLHYSADPEMSGERLEREKAKYTSDTKWRQEMEIDWSAKSGALVYPEFSESIHVIPHEEIPRSGTLFMSIDPHPRTPHAFLWVLIDEWSDWYVYRELWPSKMYGSGRRMKDSDEENTYSIRDYAQSIAVLEGHEMEIIHRGMDKEYGKFRRLPGGEKVMARLMDQAGKAFRASDEASLLETYARRYRKFGISCTDPRKSHGTGEDAIRTLLAKRKHDVKGVWPRLHISTQCPELIYEFKNHRYKTMKSENLEKDLHQDPAEVRSHQLDNLRYIATYPQANFIPRLASIRHS